MTTPLPVVDQLTLAALADCILTEFAKVPVLRKALRKARDAAQAEALRARVRRLNGPSIPETEALAREAAAALIERALCRAHQGEEHEAARSALEEAATRARRK